MDLAIPKL